MILLLTILFGSLLEGSEGLQAALSYEYDYTGTLSTWLPNDPKQFSGAALRATVELQLSHYGDILVKTSDIQVAEHNGKGACDAYEHSEFHYHEMNAQDAAFLEKPFLVHANVTQGSYMEVPQEPVWVTNIRRGIVNSIPILPLTGQLLPTLTFRSKEDTMIGTCYNWYSMLKLIGYQAKIENDKQEEVIEEDVQRDTSESYTAKTQKSKSKGRKKTTKKGPIVLDPYTAPPINDTLSILTRTLTDEKCKDNHFTIKINGNDETVKRTQRSSEGTFLLRGVGTVLRLERSEVTGDLVTYTCDSKSEFIRTKSKQTLQLKAVRQTAEEIRITYEPERRMLSYSLAHGPRSTISEKLLGIAPETQQIETNKAEILADLSVLREIKDTQGEESPDFLKIFQRMGERLTMLSWSDFEGLVNEPTNTVRDIYIMYQAFLSSGRDEALTHFLEEMKNPAFLSNHPLLVFQILEAPTTPVRDPALIPAMLEVVSGMPEELTAKPLSLLNIAKLVNRYCLNPKTGEICNLGCDTSFIINTLLPKLAEGLQDAEKWKRILSVQAVCALGSPYSIPYLQSIIQGTHNEDIDVRINAIYCLTGDFLPRTAEGEVFDSLVPLMNNPTEFPEVRSIAFLVLTTWEPNLSWWEHVAISTWKEKSVQVLSFISSTLTSLSKGDDPRSKSAKKVVHLAKHPERSERVSLAKSTYHYLYEVMKNCEDGTNVKLAWLSSTKSMFPRTVYQELQFVTVMGLPQREKGFFLTALLQDSYRRMHPALRNQKTYEDQEMFAELFMELTEDLELLPTDTHDESLMMLLVSDPLPLLFVYPPHLETDHRLTTLRMIMGQRIPVQFRLTESTLVLPLDLGLPVVIKHQEDLAFALATSASGEIQVNLNHRNALQTTTLVPWSGGMSVGAGVEASLNINLLFKATLETDSTSKTLFLGFASEQQTKIVSVTDAMYTSLTPLYRVIDSVLTPEESDSTDLGRKVVWNGAVQERRRVLLPQFGIHLQSSCTSDSGQPKDFLVFLQSISFSELRYRNLEYRLVLDPQRSRTKGVTFIFTWTIKEDDDDNDDFTQQTQGADDYDPLSQVSQTASTGFEDFGQNPPNEAVFIGDVQQSHTFTSQLDRMQQQIMPAAGGSMYTGVMVVKPENSSSKYEVAVTVVHTSATGGVEEKAVTKIHTIFMSSPMSGITGTTNMTCLDLRVETPSLLPLLPKEVLFNTDLNSKFLLNLYNGHDCDGPPGVKIQGNLGVSYASIQNLWSPEDVSTCDRDFTRESHLFYDDVIAAATWTQDFRDWSTVVINQMQLIPSASRKSEPATSDNELFVKAVLDTMNDEWNVAVSDPQGTSVYLLPGLSLVSPFTSSNIYVNLGPVCHVTSQSVKTYDGLFHAYEPSSCWTTASIYSTPTLHAPEYEPLAKLEIAVLVRFTEQWEVRLISPSSAIVIDMTSSDILVNEEPLIGDNEKFVVQRLPESTVLKIGMVTVQVGDSVNIMLSDLFYGAVNGLCGNYDGEPINDMMGPTGCHYTDHTLHTLAWSTPGVGCGRFTLRSKKRGLRQFRETCDRIVFQPSGASQENVMNNCTEWRYDERSDPMGLFCKSKVPLPACRPGCNPGNHASKAIAYSCSISSSDMQVMQYSENHRCFSTTSPAAYITGCYRL